MSYCSIPIVLLFILNIVWHSMWICRDYSREGCLDEFGKSWSNKIRTKNINMICINFRLNSKAWTNFSFCLFYIKTNQKLLFDYFCKTLSKGTQQTSFEEFSYLFSYLLSIFCYQFSEAKLRPESSWWRLRS